MSKFYHMCPVMIGPSLLASDLSNLSSESERVLKAGADFLHLDVMDGHFVPNMTFGAPVIECLRKNIKATFDVHLMVTNPEKWVDSMKKAGADIFTFHIEVTSVGNDLRPLIQKIKDTGMKVGIAIKPNTPIEAVFEYVDMLDLVLVMTVEPGFGGQSFMSNMMTKVRTLREKYPTLTIEVDGGLGPNTIDEAAAAGANMIVAGSSVFSSNIANTISILRRSVEKYGHGKQDDDLSPLIEK